MAGSGAKNSKWNGGIHSSSKGYARISTKNGKNKYVHRYIIEQLLLRPIAAYYVFPGDGVIPPKMTVHHCDHRTTHNCEGNLQLLDRSIHIAIESHYRRWIIDHYKEWVAYWSTEEPEDRWE